MATTNVEICNLALDNLGHTNKIVALTDQTKEGRACARWYAQIGEYLLRKYPWPFAARSAALELIEDPLIVHPSWAYLYTVPTDLLLLRRLFIEGTPRNGTPIPGGIVQGSTTVGELHIGCDYNTGVIAEYTAKMVSTANDTFVPFLPPEFVDAFAWKLAARLVTPLALDKGLIEEAETMFFRAVADAFAIGSAEMRHDEPLDADYIRERG